MRKQFKKIMSVVLAAAMVLSLSSGVSRRIASAEDAAPAATLTPTATPAPAASATETADEVVGTIPPIIPSDPVDIFNISRPFDIGICANVNEALTEEMVDAEAEGGKIRASVFGTAEYWDLLQTDASLLGTYGEHKQTFYKSNDNEYGSLHITQTGKYELSVTALGDSENLADSGAIWFQMVPNQMPTDYNLIGTTITVGDKAYAWNAQLYDDVSGVRLSVCNIWASAAYKDIANPVKDVIPVKKGDRITFTFMVLGYTMPQATPTPISTPKPLADSYNAYLGFQTDNWILRDTWNNKIYGLDSNYYDYTKQIAVSSGQKNEAVDAVIKDAEITKGVTNYEISISGVNLRDQKGGGENGALATQFNMIFISTDIPLTVEGVECTDAVLKLDGETIKEYKTVPCKADAVDYYMLMLADAYAPGDGTDDAEYSQGAPLTILPTDSIEVSFSISGVVFKSDSTEGADAQATATPVPTKTATATKTPKPTETAVVATKMPKPTETVAAPTGTPIPTETSAAVTGTPAPTETSAAVTGTPIPTETSATETATPVLTESPVTETATPAVSTETPGTTVKTGSKQKVGGVTYKVTGSKTAEYSKPKKNAKKVTIPKTVTISGKTYKVTTISAKTFSGNKDLKSIEIGKNVTKIGKQAFYNCTNLKKITFQGTAVKTIGAKAFANGAKKPTITAPKKSLNSIKKMMKKAGIDKKAIYKKK